MSIEKEYQEINEFLIKVCHHVRAKKLHQEIKEELLDHIEGHVSDHLAEGLKKGDAVKKAIQRLGDSNEIGREFDKAHRPHTNWGLIIPLLLISAAGLMTMFSIVSQLDYKIYTPFFERKLLFTCAGLAVMALLWTIDYQKLKKYSEYFFVAGLIVLVVDPLFGLTMGNGQRTWLEIGGGFTLFVPIVSILALILGLAGASQAKNWDMKSTIIQLAYRGVLPVFLLAQLNIFTWVIVYAVVFIVHIWMTRKNVLQVISIGFGCCCLLFVAILSSDYLLYRMLSYLRQNVDPLGPGYMLKNSMEAMNTTNWWGHGISASGVIRYASSEAVLPYFIYCFGWIAGLSLLIIILSFIYRLISSVIFIKDEFGKRITAGICTLLVVQFTWSMLMVFGYAPYVNMDVPFLSYGGTTGMIHFAMIGLLLSIYRRRDMVVLTNMIK